MNPQPTPITHQEAWSVVRSLSAACVERNARVPASMRIEPRPSLCPLRFDQSDARFIAIGGTVIRLHRGTDGSRWLDQEDRRWSVTAAGMESLMRFVGACHHQSRVATRLG